MGVIGPWMVTHGGGTHLLYAPRALRRRPGTFLSWRWAFLINLLIAVSIAIATPAVIAESRHPERPRPDAPGAVTVTAGLLGAFFAIERRSQAPLAPGWPSRRRDRGRHRGDGRAVGHRADGHKGDAVRRPGPTGRRLRDASNSLPTRWIPSERTAGDRGGLIIRDCCSARASTEGIGRNLRLHQAERRNCSPCRGEDGGSATRGDHTGRRATGPTCAPSCRYH
jgi:hypothetical protein